MATAHERLVNAKGLACLTRYNLTTPPHPCDAAIAEALRSGKFSISGLVAKTGAMQHSVNRALRDMPGVMRTDSTPKLYWIGETNAVCISIGWLGRCDKCNADAPHSVHTTSRDPAYIHAGDAVSCGACGHTGTVSVYDGVAQADWDEM